MNLLSQIEARVVLVQQVINNSIFSTTKVNIEPPPFTIDHHESIFTIGSCFASEISNQLQKSFISVSSNPFGTIYNIKSIFDNLKRIIDSKEFTDLDIEYYNGKYLSYETTTEFDSNNKKNTLDLLNKRLSEASLQLKEAKTIIITPGTSVIYSYNNNIVANCHKVPLTNFIKSILTVDRTTKILSDIVRILQDFNKNINIILTLSPVRHTLSNLTENQYSKSVIRCAIEETILSNNSKHIYYFPSYEIVMDELRNYEVYCDDGAHIKEKYIQYITDLFMKECFVKSFIKQLTDLRYLIGLLNHNQKDINHNLTIENNNKIEKELQEIRKKDHQLYNNICNYYKIKNHPFFI